MTRFVRLGLPLIGLLLLTLTTAAEDKKPEVKVRALDHKLLGNLPPSPGKPGVTVSTSEEELAKIVGEKAAAAVAQKVDFKTEQVVYLYYETSGPPFGKVAHQVDKDGKVEFTVVEPKVGARGQALKLGREIYAVTRGAKVTYGGQK